MLFFLFNCFEMEKTFELTSEESNGHLNFEHVQNIFALNLYAYFNFFAKLFSFFLELLMTTRFNISPYC